MMKRKESPEDTREGRAREDEEVASVDCEPWFTEVVTAK
jgi:hypothetical protein